MLRIFLIMTLTIFAFKSNAGSYILNLSDIDSKQSGLHFQFEVVFKLNSLDSGNIESSLSTEVMDVKKGLKFELSDDQINEMKSEILENLPPKTELLNYRINAILYQNYGTSVLALGSLYIGDSNEKKRVLHSEEGSPVTFIMNVWRNGELDS